MGRTGVDEKLSVVLAVGKLVFFFPLLHFTYLSQGQPVLPGLFRSPQEEEQVGYLFGAARVILVASSGAVAYVAQIHVDAPMRQLHTGSRAIHLCV